MEIVNIFAVVEKALFSVKFKGKRADEFVLNFRQWNDIEYLEEFFEKHKSDLQSGFYGDITIEEAIEKTINDAEKIETYIKSVAKQGLSNSNKTLDRLVFTKLSENDYSLTHLKSKAYGRSKQTWLRIYAIRLSNNLYVVSGGAIKLTKTMNERTHTKRELLKLNATKDYLVERGIIDGDDYDLLEISNNE